MVSQREQTAEALGGLNLSVGSYFSSWLCPDGLLGTLCALTLQALVWMQPSALALVPAWIPPLGLASTPVSRLLWCWRSFLRNCGLGSGLATAFGADFASRSFSRGLVSACWRGGVELHAEHLFLGSRLAGEDLELPCALLHEHLHAGDDVNHHSWAKSDQAGFPAGCRPGRRPVWYLGPWLRAAQAPCCLPCLRVWR